MKYTIKELLDKAFKVEDVYKRFHDYFTNEDIEYAIKKDNSDDFYWLIYFLHSKLNEQNIKSIIDSGKNIEWLINKRQLWNKELVKYAIEHLYLTRNLRDLSIFERAYFDEEMWILYEKRVKLRF
jgi:hypothetical protein